MVPTKVEVEFLRDLLTALDIPEAELGRRVKEWVILLEAALGRGVDLLTEASLSPYLRERMLRDLQVLYKAADLGERCP